MRVEHSGSFGDIKSLKVKIEGEDVTQAILFVEIFQDIFTPCWSGVVGINDSTNLLMRLPIRPGAKLTVDVETKTESPVMDGTKSYPFVIYKLGDKILEGQMNQKYNLYCATQGFLKNQSIRVQKSYPSQKPETTVSNIISEFMGGSVESDTSDSNYHVIIPNWSPFTAAWWCAKLAIKNGASDFIFYMKDIDKYWFKSIEELYLNEDTGITFAQKPSGFKNDAGDFEDDYSIMITKYHFEHYDGMSNLGTGYYKNKLLTYDMINKKWESKVFSYGDDIAKDKEMKPWDTELFDGAENANVSFLPKHPGLHASPTIDDTVTTWHPSRKTNLMKLEQDKYTLQLPGGAKCWEWLGRNCDIDLPSHQDIDEEEKLDKYFKGRYLITHIYHYITHDYYVTNLECCKKRLNEKMSGGK
jgi:hypothetical protein